MLPNQKEIHPQVQDRRWRIYTDQHGRRWGATESKQTGRPAEPLNPYGWRAPVKGGQTPERYFRFSDDPANTQSFVIDYDALIGAYRESDDEWSREVHRLSVRFPDKSRAQCEDIAGPRPFPWQYWQACRDPKADGHAWALGQSSERPAWAETFFPPPETTEAEASFLYPTKAAKSAKAAAGV